MKAQRPDIRIQIAEDFEVLEEIATFFNEHTDVGRRYQFVKVLADFKATLMQELDYQREAVNLTTLAVNLKEFTRIQVPLPVPDFNSRCVLTMDYVVIGPAFSDQTEFLPMTGIKWRILYGLMPPCVMLCRLMSEYVGIFYFLREQISGLAFLWTPPAAFC